MKKIIYISFLLILLSALPLYAQQQVVLQDSIAGNIHLTADKTYLIRGYVYIVNGATLTIDPGALLFGEKSTKGCIITERGGKLIAKGTAQKPIIFTSQAAVGQRSAGDWGGIILCGKAPINQNNLSNGGLMPGGDNQIEGGPRSHYGGTDVHDNSGDLEYVRIEFPGIPLAPNNEINGLTLGGVGDATIIDHVQVSYSGDDSYEWFGGTVHSKHLIAFKGLDDDWDTDFGFSGGVQFGVSLRDPNIADVSQSNGFESDNDNPPNFWNPRTSAVFSNMTVVGPQPDTTAPFNPLFGRGAHIRRNTLLNIYNSIVMGWPIGLVMDQTGVVEAAGHDTLQIRNCIWAGLRTGNGIISNVNSFDALQWYRTSSFANNDYLQPSIVKLTDPFNQSTPNFTPLPGSPALTGAGFAHAKIVADTFFEKVTYRGAFGTGPRWDSVWVNYDPKNTNYDPTASAAVTEVNFTKVAVGATKDSSVVIIKNSGVAPVVISSVTILDDSKFKLVNPSLPVTLLVGESKSLTIRFAPTDTQLVSTKIRFATGNSQTVEVNLLGKGVSATPIVTVAASHDFALVQVNQSVTHTIDIANTGTGKLSLSGISITGADASQFTIVSGGTAGDIAPGAKQTVGIKFTPASVGDKTATLQFTHNAPSGTKSVNLTGKGIVVYGQDVLKDSITGNVTLTNDRTWLIRGFVYIVNGSTLNIEPGTVLYGEKSTKGCLIVERGGKLIAKGTADQPILFLSQQAPGERSAGDWGGIILCGRAPINQNNSINGGLVAGGDNQIEGGPRSHYGGTDAHDNSGDLEYVRIEFPGIPLAPNNEINGLTLGGVGDATIIDHVQISYSGDDSYEWFGGTVLSKHLIAFKGLDDDWDNDFGFSGGVQFGVSLRDPNIADVSQSNGFESDNDNPPNFWNPRTSAVFCNMTVVGPQSDTGATFNPLFGKGAHIRRNSEMNIYNSIVMGWPIGLVLDQTGVVGAATKDTIQIRNCIWAGLRGPNGFVTNVSGFNTGNWYRTPNFDNSDYVQPAEVKLAAPFNLTAPNFTPQDGSPALTGASFANVRLSSNPFFESVNYRGAFGPGPRWDSGWTNYDPQNTVYAPKPTVLVSNITFPTLKPNATTDTVVSAVISNTGNVVLGISNWGLTDSSVFTIVGGNAPFSITPGKSKSISLRFHPTAEGTFTSKLQFNFVTKEQMAEVTINGSATASGVKDASLENGVELFQNTPNPVDAGTTNIMYSLTKPDHVTLEILDVTGKVISKPISMHQNEGAHTFTLHTNEFVNGTYIYRLTVGNYSVAKRMVIVK